MDLFGWSIKKKEDELGYGQDLLAAVPQTANDDSIIINTPGGFSRTGTEYNTDFRTSSVAALIDKYREISLQAEIESAIDEIVNDMVYAGSQDALVKIVLDNTPYSDELKEKVTEEFNTILELLNFNENSYELIKRWYVDGRLYFNVVIDAKKANRDGIVELRYLDPRLLQKVKEVKETKVRGGSRVPTNYNEYWMLKNPDQILKLPKDSVSGTTSGLIDNSSNSLVLSYLHKVIKPYNQLRMLEDAAVIYRLARAPERRVFKVDVGNLPKIKSEQYMTDIREKFRSKITYDSNTGTLRDDSKTMSMLEDFWLPVRDGKGTDVSTLPGGTNLGEIGDISYFQRKLYRALHVPVGRFDDTSVYSGGRTTEIAREELKFSKFIDRLRVRFSILFSDLLRKQLILKNIIQPEDWDLNFKNNIFYDFRQDSHFAEYNETEILSRRMELASQADSLGYYSKKFIAKNMLRLSNEELKEIESDNEVSVKSEELIPDEYSPEYTGSAIETPFGEPDGEPASPETKVGDITPIALPATPPPQTINTSKGPNT